jgi:hypothetical protein
MEDILTRLDSGVVRNYLHEMIRFSIFLFFLIFKISVFAQCLNDIHLSSLVNTNKYNINSTLNDYNYYTDYSNINYGANLTPVEYIKDFNLLTWKYNSEFIIQIYQLNNNDNLVFYKLNSSCFHNIYHDLKNVLGVKENDESLSRLAITKCIAYI